MAHEIEGNYAFFGSNTPAWHGLGTVLTEAPTIDEAWKLAYPHNLIELPIQAYTAAGTMPISDKKAIFRDDGQYIATVGDGFTIVQPYQMFNAYRSMLDSGLVELEAGGSLRDGTRMWALAKIKGTETEIVKNDTVKAYVLMAGAFDGTMKHLAKTCATRVVCANTLAIAQSEHTELNFSFKHTKTIHDRIDSTLKLIQGAIEQFKVSVEAYKYLGAKKTTLPAMKAYVKNVIATEDKVNDKGNIAARTQNVIEEIINRFDTQRGMELVPAARGTAWQAYNAVTEYVTHTYGRNADNRLNAQWFGESEKMNNRALELALQM